jgi:hypothetical protein
MPARSLVVCLAVVCLSGSLCLRAQTLPAIAQVPTGAPALQPNPSATQFTFAVAGDNRPAHHSDPLTRPLLDIVKALATTPPAFVVWDGDVVFGKEDIGIDAQYRDFIGAFAKLPVPLFNAPGNHELVVATPIACGKWTAELPDFSGAMRAGYVKSMGAASGVFRYGNAAFVIIDTDDDVDVTLTSACQYNGYVGLAQLAALKATLAQLSADPSVQHIFLFMHRPIHDPENGAQIGSPNENTSAYGKQVQAFRHAIMNGGYKKLLFVFASHDHRLFIYPAGAALARTSPGGGKPVFIVTGGAGAPLSGCESGKGTQSGAYYHYFTVAVDGANVSVTVHPLYGTALCGPPS